MRLHAKLLISMATAACLYAELAVAHTTVSPKQVSSDSYQRLSFNVTHGCEGSPTTEVILYLPDAILGAKPMPKSGWTVETEVRDLDKPYLSHGKQITRDVRVIRWRGKLLDSHYDEFVIMAKTWAKTGPVPLPVTQLCESGRMDWKEVSDGSGVKLNFPAPVLDVQPSQHPHQH